MNNTLSNLDAMGNWDEDLEIEELSSIRSATIIIIIVNPSPSPLPGTALTTVQA